MARFASPCLESFLRIAKLLVLYQPFDSLYGSLPLSCIAERLVDDGERLELTGLSFEVREIPGHSPGSVVFLCDQFEPAFVFGGDVLFAGSVGLAVYGFTSDDDHDAPYRPK